jgi:hypothetical protein
VSLKDFYLQLGNFIEALQNSAGAAHIGMITEKKKEFYLSK